MDDYIDRAALITLRGLAEFLEVMADTVPPLPSEPAAGPFEDGYDYAVGVVARHVRTMVENIVKAAHDAGTPGYPLKP